MKNRTRNLAMLPIAALLIMAAGCGASSKSPTGVALEDVSPAGTSTFDRLRQTNGQAPALGAAAGFAILAGSTITNSGQTVVTGDLGLSPGSAVTGFPPGIVKRRRQGVERVLAGR